MPPRSLRVDDRVTLKVIDNILGTGLPIRLSFSQFQTNPFQHGYSTALIAAPGCATVNLFPNGFSNPTVPDTAEEASVGTTGAPSSADAGSMISTIRPHGAPRSSSTTRTSTNPQDQPARSVTEAQNPGSVLG